MKKSLGAKTLAVPAPAWAVATYGADGKPNVATAAWGGICCSRPPCVAVSFREATLTHGNILAKKAFTVNVLSEAQVEALDYFGIASGRDTDKFADSGMTAVRSEVVDAPFVGEAPLVVECRLYKVVELGLHTQFVGEVVDVKAEDTVLDTEGGVDILKVKPLVYATGGRFYLGVGDIVAQAFDVGKRVKG